MTAIRVIANLTSRAFKILNSPIVFYPQPVEAAAPIQCVDTKDAFIHNDNESPDALPMWPHGRIYSDTLVPEGFYLRIIDAQSDWVAGRTYLWPQDYVWIPFVCYVSQKDWRNPVPWPEVIDISVDLYVKGQNILDLNADGKINMIEVAVAAIHFGKPGTI